MSIYILFKPFRIKKLFSIVKKKICKISKIKCASKTFHQSDDELLLDFYSAKSNLSEINTPDNNDMMTGQENGKICLRIIGTDIFQNLNEFDHAQLESELNYWKSNNNKEEQSNKNELSLYDIKLDKYMNVISEYCNEIAKLSKNYGLENVMKQIIWTNNFHKWWNVSELKKNNTSSWSAQQFFSYEVALYVIRFCEGNSWNVDSIVDNLKYDMYWRMQCNVYEMWKKYLYAYPEVIKFHPHGYYGIDKFGHPVYYDCVGRINSKHILSNYTIEDVEKYYIAQNEYLQRTILPACSIFKKKRISKIISIIDFTNFSLLQLTKQNRNFIKFVLSIGQTHYPDSVEKVYIINSKYFMRTVANVFRNMFTNEMQNAFEFIENNKLLLDIIEKNQIPDFIYNNSPDISWCNNNKVGPWVDKEILTYVEKMQY